MEIKGLSWTKCPILDNFKTWIGTQKFYRTLSIIAFKMSSQKPYDWSLTPTQLILGTSKDKLRTRYEMNLSQSQANGLKVENPTRISLAFSFASLLSNGLTKPINIEPNPNLCSFHQTHPIVLCRYALNLFLIFFFFIIVAGQYTIYFWDFCFWYFLFLYKIVKRQFAKKVNDDKKLDFFFYINSLKMSNFFHD